MRPESDTLETWQAFAPGEVTALALDEGGGINSATMHDRSRRTLYDELFGMIDAWMPCGRETGDCRPTRHPLRPDNERYVRHYDGVRGAIGPVRASTQMGVAACAARADGRVACWRLDDDPAPAQVPVVTDARGLVMGCGDLGGDFSACAWSGDGRAWCWGDDSYGQLGDGRHGLDYLAPVALPVP